MKGSSILLSIFENNVHLELKKFFAVDLHTTNSIASRG